MTSTTSVKSGISANAVKSCQMLKPEIEKAGVTGTAKREDNIHYKKKEKLLVVQLYDYLYTGKLKSTSVFEEMEEGMVYLFFC